MVAVLTAEPVLAAARHRFAARMRAESPAAAVGVHVAEDPFRLVDAELVVPEVLVVLGGLAARTSNVRLGGCCTGGRRACST